MSDKDPVSTSRFYTHLFLFLDVKQRKSSPFHPQTDGQAERTNQTLKQVLRAITMEVISRRGTSVEWLQMVGHAEVAINTAPLANT